MIKQVDIANFRSIKEQSIPLKKLNILYGPNGSGKSSVMYAPYVFKNLCINPNQRLDSLFNLGFINLGGYKNIVDSGEYGYKILSITFHIGIGEPDHNIEYKVDLDNEDGVLGSILSFKYRAISETIPLELPSSLMKKVPVKIDDSTFYWNGFTFETHENTYTSTAIVTGLNKIYESVKNIEIISVRRGFFNPIFSTEQASEESLFAMQIREEGSNFESLIDHYFKQIFDKTFRFVAIPGSTSFYLRTQNKKGFTIDLVNEGFGVNQTIYMLIKLLKRSTSLAFIEEPEIHLHPSAQNKLVDVFSEIIQKENKQIFLTTHSENIVSSVLNKISKGELSTDDVQFYLAKVENDETKIIPQNVNEKGQIEGGLMSFMETELQNLKSLLGI